MSKNAWSDEEMEERVWGGGTAMHACWLAADMGSDTSHATRNFGSNYPTLVGESVWNLRYTNRKERIDFDQYQKFMYSSIFCSCKKIVYFSWRVNTYNTGGDDQDTLRKREGNEGTFQHLHNAST